MGSFELFLQKMMTNIGGGEEPKPSKEKFKNQKEINDWNAWTQNFLIRKGAPMAYQTVVGRDVGDAKPNFVYSQGSVQPDRPMLQTTLPKDVPISEVFQNQDGQYGYLHPQQGNWVQVDPQSIYSKYGSKK